jgi:hypothetical protein
MATASNGGNNTAPMANLNRGPRNLSAGDWTRIQRLRGAKPYGYVSGGMPTQGTNNITASQFAVNSDIYTTPGNQQPYGTALLIKPVVGTSKTRRTASNWTDFVAAAHGDFITTGQAVGANGLGTPAITQTINTIAGGTSSTLPAKAVNPGVNQFTRQKILS